ncbi:MAG: hypothetical protein F4X89_06030 [Dehalococcoidia bacterium]|nr:hypothetical protein [Dehalococcoidia bacterium]
MKRLAPLAASIMAGLASASGAAICSPTNPRSDERVCVESLIRTARMPAYSFPFDTGVDPELARAFNPWYPGTREVPARQLVLLHDSGPRRQAGDPEPSPVQPVEVNAEPMRSLPVATPVPEQPARRGMSPVVWTLAIVSILALLLLSSPPV